MGLSPMIGETVPHNLKRYLGVFGYLIWAAWCLVRFAPFRLSVDDGQKTHRIWTTEVRIFNGRFHGGVELADDAEVDSGEIVIQAVTGRSLWRLARDWFAKYFRLRSRNDTTVEFRGSRLVIDTRPRHKISIDGEVLARTPVTVEVAHKAIEVVVPACPA
jgi:diacylglycerol kinase family enzyme